MALRSLFICILLFLLSSGSIARAQISYDTGKDTIFAHSQTLPYWISGQGNFIFQWHPRFPARYSGPHSFEHASEQAASEVLTLYTGLQVGPYMEALLDVESAGGSGLSQVLGLGGFQCRCGEGPFTNCGTIFRESRVAPDNSLEPRGCSG